MLTLCLFSAEVALNSIFTCPFKLSKIPMKSPSVLLYFKLYIALLYCIFKGGYTALSKAPANTVSASNMIGGMLSITFYHPEGKVYLILFPSQTESS